MLPIMIELTSRQVGLNLPVAPLNRPIILTSSICEIEPFEQGSAINFISGEELSVMESPAKIRELIDNEVKRMAMEWGYGLEMGRQEYINVMAQLPLHPTG